MNTIRVSMVLAALLQAWLFCFAESPTDKDVLRRIMDRVKQNDRAAEEFGYYYQSQVREIDGDGNVEKDEKQLYHIVWIEGEQYFELLKVNDRDLNAAEKKEEEQRRKQFVNNLHQKKTSELRMDWEELFQKYTYAVLPPEGDARYVVTFEPKQDGLKERTRMEKVFNHLAGKVWVDSGYNVLKANLWLSDTVKFGLGLLGSLNELQLQYSQQKYGSDVWMPDRLRLNYSVRIVLKGKHESMEGRFYDIYPRPDAKTSPAKN